MSARRCWKTRRSHGSGRLMARSRSSPRLAGAVTNLPVHNGDSVTAGSMIAAIGDVSRLRVETDDVDEFMVARIRPGQAVTVTVDAIEGRSTRPRPNRSPALREDRGGRRPLPGHGRPRLGAADCRSGMTVRVNFPDQ